MLKDKNGKKVNEGDLLVQKGEDQINVFKVIKGKPILVCKWAIGQIMISNLIRLSKDISIAEEKGMSNYVINLLKDIRDQLETIEVSNLELVQGVNVRIFNKFVNEQYENIVYMSNDDNKFNPTAYFLDEEIEGEFI